MPTSLQLPWHYLATTVCILEGKTTGNDKIPDASSQLCERLADDRKLTRQIVRGERTADGSVSVLMHEIGELVRGHLKLGLKWETSEAALLDIVPRRMPKLLPNQKPSLDRSREYVLVPGGTSANAKMTLYVPWPFFPPNPQDDHKLCREKTVTHLEGNSTPESTASEDEQKADSEDLLIPRVDLTRGKPRMFVRATLDSVDALLYCDNTGIGNEPSKEPRPDINARSRRLRREYQLGTFGSSKAESVEKKNTYIEVHPDRLHLVLGLKENGPEVNEPHSLVEKKRIGAWPCGALTGDDRPKGYCT